VEVIQAMAAENDMGETEEDDDVSAGETEERMRERERDRATHKPDAGKAKALGTQGIGPMKGCLSYFYSSIQCHFYL